MMMFLSFFSKLPKSNLVTPCQVAFVQKPDFMSDVLVISRTFKHWTRNPYEFLTEPIIELNEMLK